MSSYTRRALSGITSMFTGTLGRQIIAFLPNVFLVRLLTPEDFGAVALVLSVSGVLKVFSDMGISVAIVQRKEMSLSLLNSAFMANLVATVTISLGLWVGAPLAALFFGIPSLTNLLRIAALSYVFSGLFSLYRSLLLRAMRYSTIALLEVLNSLVYGVVAVILAGLGYGASSVAWAQVAATMTLALMGLHFTRFVPRGVGTISDAVQLLRFGGWIALSRVLGQASGHIDAFFIGRFLDEAALGQYFLAQRVVMLIPGAYTSIIDQVTLPIYSRWQDDPSRIQDGYWKAFRYGLMLILPAVVLLMLLAEFVVELVLGAAWLEIVPLVRVMSLFALTHSMGGGIFGSVIYATGRPELATLVSVFRITALPLCVGIGAMVSGVLGAAYGFALFGMIGRLFNQGLLTYKLGFGWSPFGRVITGPISAALGASIAALSWQALFPSFESVSVVQIVIHAVFVLVWLGVYVLLLLRFDSHNVRQLVFTVREWVNGLRTGRAV